ncbi:MAG: sporulation protein YqfD, partial [Clostridia bacterium]|nr:sporulation protein YqfD [Clostridia bacterium]
RVGMPVRAVRAHIIRNSVMEQSDKIAFLTVNMSGTTAKVRIYEKSSAEADDFPEVCDVVSGLTGIITDIRIKNGTSQVRRWQSIYEGDLIASAEMTDKHGRVRQVCADAEIDVRSVYTRRCAVAKELFEYIPTSNTKKRSYLVVGNRSIKLYLIEKIEYKWYYKDVCRKTLSLREGFDLPVTLVTETYTECLRQEYTPSDGQLEKLLEGRMTTAFLLQRPSAAIADSHFELISVGSAYEGILRLECSETTGIQIAR